MPARIMSRKHLFVDPEIQGRLVLRVVLYWLLCLVGVGLMLLCWRIGTGPVKSFEEHLRDVWRENAPALAASLLLLPLALVDMLRLSNRFLGPMLRLRRSMRQTGRGELVQPLQIRHGDLCHDMADEYNAVVERLRASADTPPLAAWQPAESDGNDDNFIACA